MRFLIAFDLPDRDDPEREFTQPDLRQGMIKAKRMELTLRLYLESMENITFFLYAWDEESREWAPAYQLSPNHFRYEQE